MKSQFIVFDLDNTLVDSLHLKSLRDARRWPGDAIDELAKTGVHFTKGVSK